MRMLFMQRERREAFFMTIKTWDSPRFNNESLSSLIQDDIFVLSYLIRCTFFQYNFFNGLSQPFLKLFSAEEFSLSIRFTADNSPSTAVLYAFPRYFADNHPVTAKVSSYPKNTSDKMPATAEVLPYWLHFAGNPPATAKILPCRLHLAGNSLSTAELYASLECFAGNPPAAAKVPSYPKNTSDKMPATAEFFLFICFTSATPLFKAAFFSSMRFVADKVYLSHIGWSRLADCVFLDLFESFLNTNFFPMKKYSI